MSRYTRVLVAVLVLSLVLAGVAWADGVVYRDGLAAPAQQQSAPGGKGGQQGQIQVGLVVLFPDGQVHTEVVKVPAGATVAAVLQKANVPVTITDTGWGPALCAIDSVGCPADNCFCDPQKFWAFYVQQGDKWVPASVGVGSYTPQDQEVVGFAWSGFDANYNPTVQPPFLTFADLIMPYEIPEPASMALLGGGLVALAGYVRRRRAA